MGQHKRKKRQGRGGAENGIRGLEGESNSEDHDLCGKRKKMIKMKGGGAKLNRRQPKGS